MLGLPWWVAPRDLTAGEVVRIGRAVDEGSHPPTAHDVTYTIGEDAPAGTVLGVDSADGRLHRVTAANTRRART
jgi:hypothetical protein